VETEARREASLAASPRRLHQPRGVARHLFLERTARDLIDRGDAQAILLAGTDLSSFYAEQPPSFPFLDVARLHIDEILRRAIAA
jgi:aspartate/glutamate racemase